MRILYFHQHFSTPSGAAGVRSYHMARALVVAGHEVTVVCGSYNAANTGLDEPFRNGVRSGFVDGIRVVEFELPYANRDSLRQRAWTFFKFALRSVKLAIAQPADLIFATSTPLTAGIPGVAARVLRGRRFVFEVRDLWPELPRAMGVVTNPLLLGVLSALEWLSYRSASACIGLSPGIVDGIKGRGVRGDRVAMIPNGCDLSFFDAVREAALRPEGVGENELLAIYAGTLGNANGVAAALDAATVLLRRGRTDIKLCFIGQGSERSELMKRAQSEGLRNCIFLDLMPKQELARYLLGANLGMQLLRNVPAFYYGTSPNKFFDYIAAGLPVLNNYPGWVADMIVEYRCGYAVRPDDPDAFANALESAADCGAKLKSMGERSKALADKFDRDRLAQSFVAWLERQMPTR